MITQKQKEEDLKWLSENHPHYIDYYPQTRRVKLADGKHYSLRELKGEVFNSIPVNNINTGDPTTVTVVDLDEAIGEKPKRRRRRKTKGEDD